MVSGLASPSGTPKVLWEIQSSSNFAVGTPINASVAMSVYSSPVEAFIDPGIEESELEGTRSERLGMLIAVLGAPLGRVFPEPQLGTFPARLYVLCGDSCPTGSGASAQGDLSQLSSFWCLNSG